MNKSFYILNTPLSCFTCDCCHTKDYDYRKQIDSEKFCGIENRNVNDYCDYVNPRKPDWCPLKEIPKRKEKVKYYGNGVLGINDMSKSIFNDGYNACLDEILNGGQ